MNTDFVVFAEPLASTVDEIFWLKSGFKRGNEKLGRHFQITSRGVAVLLAPGAQEAAFAHAHRSLAHERIQREAAAIGADTAAVSGLTVPDTMVAR